MVDTNAPAFSQQFYRDIDKEVSLMRRFPGCCVCGKRFPRMVFSEVDYSFYCKRCYKKKKEEV